MCSKLYCPCLLSVHLRMFVSCVNKLERQSSQLLLVTCRSAQFVVTYIVLVNTLFLRQEIYILRCVALVWHQVVFIISAAECVCVLCSVSSKLPFQCIVIVLLCLVFCVKQLTIPILISFCCCVRQVIAVSLYCCVHLYAAGCVLCSVSSK